MRVHFVLTLAALVCIQALALSATAAAQNALGEESCPDDANLFPIDRDGKWGFIDASGHVVLEPQYDKAWNFSQGWARVHTVRGFAFVNPQGEPIQIPHSEEALDFREGRAAVKVRGKWGFTDHKGNLVISPRFDLVDSFHEGLAPVRTGHEWRYIDKAGRLMDIGATGRDPGYLDVFHEGLASQLALDGSFGFIDKQGNWAIQPQFREAQPFHEALAAVVINDEWGYINKQGQLMIPAEFSQAGPFRGGMAAVRIPDSQGGKVGFIDHKGKFVVPPTFDAATLFCKGLAAVRRDRLWGYMDKTGSLIIQPRFILANSFAGDLAGIVVEDDSGVRHRAYIDKTRKHVWISPDPVFVVD